MIQIQFRVPKGHIVLRSNISYRRYIVNSAGIYIADFIFDEIIIVKLFAIYSLRSCDILASLVRYTRFARTIYSLCSYDIFCFAKCDITSICSVAILLSHAFYCLFFAVVTDEINFLLIIPHLLIRCLYVVSSMEFTLKSISNQYSVS